MTPPSPLLVLGAGVSGLSCALAARAAGATVRIWTREAPAHTTSRVAAALWFPFAVGPAQRVASWAPTAHACFCRLAASPLAQAAGVNLRETLELFPGEAPEPRWRATLEGFRAARPDELGPAHASGWVYTTPVIDMRRYLDFLVAALAERGVEIETRPCEDLDAALEACPTVVNCTGLGSRALCGDDALEAVRGQIHEIAGVSPARVRLDEERGQAVRYVVPLGDATVIGGSVEPGIESLDEDDELRRAIEADCRALAPELGEAPITSTRVGLRPCRPAIRLELETRARGRIIHNYGHGGAGVTLSWGCAREVMEMAGLPLVDDPWASPST